MIEAARPPLPVGYSEIASGQIAAVVTSLEMTARPRPKPAPLGAVAATLQPLARDDLDGYRALFRRVGESWLWTSRLVMADEALAAILGDARVALYVLNQRTGPIGLLELDFRRPDTCEIAFFGLVPEAVGRGLGRCLMERTIALAWAQPIKRLWVHTCTFDHPRALEFYRRSGFVPFATAVEVMDDPRLTGLLPRTAAPHVPLIG